MKKVTAVALGSLLIGAFSVNAAPAKSAKQAYGAIQYRQAIFQLVKSNVGILGAMNKGAIPFDANKIETNALRLEQLSLMLEDYFETDTSGFNVESGSLDKIWTDQTGFKDKISALTIAASNLKKVAKAGDTSQFKPAIGGVFKSCKGCHDNYRED